MREEKPKQKRGWVTYCDPVHIAIVPAGAIEVDFVLTKNQEGEEQMGEQKTEDKSKELEQFEVELEKAGEGAVGILKDLVSQALKVEDLPAKAKGLLEKIEAGLKKLPGYAYGYPKKQVEESVRKAVTETLDSRDATELKKMKEEHVKELEEVLEKVKRDFVPKEKVKQLVKESIEKAMQ